MEKIGVFLAEGFEEIEALAGVPLDHSFLQYKKELAAFGWQVKKISMKGQTVLFQRTEGEAI